jgi:hypothetical protein
MSAIAFQGISPGGTFAPGQRIRTVWLLTGLGEVAAAASPWSNATDRVSKGAQSVIDGVTARQLGYVTNVPPAIAPGDLGVVLDIRLASTGPARSAAEVARFLADLPASATIRLDRIGPVPSGESLASALREREAATTSANTTAADTLPSGVIAGAADAAGDAVRSALSWVKWTALVIVAVAIVYAWRTYGRGA